MPGRLERHRRSKWEWGLPGSRSAEVRAAGGADPDPAKRAPSAKDTRHLCKGRPGMEHVPHLVLAADTPQQHGTACRWKTLWDWQEGTGWVTGWACGHREECARCGKVTRPASLIPAGECPAWPGDPGQRAGADAVTAGLRERPVTPSRRRKVITGPQGYRRRRRPANTDPPP